MRNLFLIATLLMVSLGGCTVVVHDTAPHRTTRAYCTICSGYGCTHRHHRSYYRTVVVEKTYHTPSSHRYAPPRRHTRYVPSAPAAPRQVRRSYPHSTSRSKTTYQSSRTRQQVSRSKTTYQSSRRQASRSRATHQAPERADERRRTSKRVKSRR